MKRSFFMALAVSSLFGAPLAMAQSDYEGGQSSYTFKDYTAKRTSQIQIAPIVGVASSGLGGVKGINGVSLESHAGTVVGAQVIIGQGPLQFETGLTHASRGFEVKNDSSNAKLIFETRYLEVPLLARFNFQNQAETHFFLRGGGILSSYQGVSTKTENMTGNITGDANEIFEKTDFRLSAGGGMNVKLQAKMFWVLQMDVQVGTQNVVKKDHLQDLDNKMVAANLMTGLAFDL